MSNIVIIDSIGRNRGAPSSSLGLGLNPSTKTSPANFTIDPAKIANTNPFMRTHVQNQKSPLFRMDEFYTSVKIIHIIMPYIAGVTDTLSMMYLNLRSDNYRSDVLIHSTISKAQTANFPVFFDKVQTNDGGTKKFVHFKSNGYTQVMRVHRNHPFIVQYFDRNGDIIVITGDNDETVPPNPDLQTLVAFEMEPFINDSSFANHNVQPLPAI